MSSTQRRRRKLTSVKLYAVNEKKKLFVNDGCTHLPGITSNYAVEMYEKICFSFFSKYKTIKFSERQFGHNHYPITSHIYTSKTNFVANSLKMKATEDL